MLLILLKVLIPSIILVVWLFRQNVASTFRAGEVSNLKDEFAFFGLSNKIYYLTGIIKITLALTLFASIWIEQLTVISSIGIAFFMLSAFFCHIKVRDKFYRSVPSFLMFLLSLTVCVIP
tara:strand:+ start:588 stop:947 length:360 start_codon:yes stop_codon:yes gene_type:complete